jgi:ATP/maltotriose-dependent transcriptional regulator MalT
VIETLEPMLSAAPMLAALNFWPTLVTALIADGQLERAEACIEDLAEAAGARGLDMAARVLGLRAGLATAGGALHEADVLFTAALEQFGPDDPFLERTLLLHGHGLVQLDRGQRAEGVATLREADRLLASVGAAPFARRVESDLRRTGTRSGRRSARSSPELTDRERDVAVLVAKGYSNPEVASELYVSRKAIEYHLQNIYGKLGITSRKQLRGLEL